MTQQNLYKNINIGIFFNKNIKEKDTTIDIKINNTVSSLLCFFQLKFIDAFVTIVFD